MHSTSHTVGGYHRSDTVLLYKQEVRQAEGALHDEVVTYVMQCPDRVGRINSACQAVHTNVYTGRT